MIPGGAAPMPESVEHARLAGHPTNRARTPWGSLSAYFTQQHRLFEDTELAALLEPRRVQAPPGYHSTKCVSAGLFALLENRILKAAVGLPHVPTEIAAHVVAYQVIRYRVPIYFIDGEFVRAVAATDDPDLSGDCGELLFSIEHGLGEKPGSGNSNDIWQRQRLVRRDVLFHGCAVHFLLYGCAFHPAELR